jgi:hypothetical protein
MPTFNHIFPGANFKDWNEMLVAAGDEQFLVADYAKQYKPYDWANMVLSGL